ncbi:NADH-ubiquinone oxidoreductase 21.3 kDa subunit [Lachnellula occidentalis]|uniref:NADH-ubiquinone oxidoreductase 21.3 kDa subunit n=1 Tax=Lachnellula occidentalis TaxID=215460 RepID=A0A8H8RZV4_9HELO|nr:NADH-ubiquinone oxidoreductase 21.3 kDa subunit [Lachnellula occidentalis]
MASQNAAKALHAVERVMPVHKKYTIQSTGIWERIRRALAVDPTRSNGVPLNPQYRNPPPGSNEPLAFIDPVTIPAGDIAENPYWKRDSRRSYPQLSFVNQADAVALLSVGSEAAPKKELIGEEGGKALVQAKGEGEKGLAAHFEAVGKEGVLEALGKGVCRRYPVVSVPDLSIEGVEETLLCIVHMENGLLHRN